VNASLSAVAVYERFGFVPSGAEVRAHGIAFLPMRMALKNDA
jgi:predicted GNAT family N-acyltransferase